MRSPLINEYVALTKLHATEAPTDEVMDQLDKLWFGMNLDEQHEAHRQIAKHFGLPA